MNSVNLILLDIDPSEFGENFHPSKLDFENEDRQKTRESVLKVLKKVVDLSNSNLQKNLDGLLAQNLTKMKISYGLEKVENVYMKIYLPFLIKEKKNNMQIPVEVWTLIFTYLRLNDLIEISCVCKEFYYLSEKNRFYVKRLQESKRIFKGRDWIFSHYKQLFDRFYFNLFKQLVPYVPIENLHVF